MLKKIKILLSLALLLMLINFNPLPTQASSTAIIDNYITVNSVTKNDNGTISVNYTMKKDFQTKLPSNVKQSLKISASMDAAYNSKPVSKDVNPKAGTYSLSLPKPSPNNLGTQVVSIEWGSQGQSQNKRLGVVYNVPDTSMKRSKPHKVTAVEAAGGYLAMTALPYAAVNFVFKGSSATVTHVAKKGVGIIGSLVGFNLAVGTFNQMPALTTGQVYYTERTIKTDGKIYTKLLIFANEATYKEFEKSKYTKDNLAIYNPGILVTPLKF